MSPLRLALLLAGASPFIAVVLHVLGWAAASAPLDAWFAFQCHQAPWRGFHVPGHALPVCARCTGIYAGVALGALVARPKLGVASTWIWVLAASAAMLLDTTTEYLGLRPESSLLRALTGIALGYPVAAALSTRLLATVTPSSS